MKRLSYIYIMTFLVLLAGSGMECHAQRFWEKKPTKTSKTKKESKSIPFQPARASAQRDSSNVLEFIVEEGDTIYIDQIKASKVYSRLPKQKGKDWRKYYRLVHNFSKTYPYALAARKIVARADQNIAENKLKRLKRDRYINAVQEELFEVFEEPLRNLTISQGALLMKLIDREIGKSSYLIIKDYKNTIAAKFWQGVAQLFGSDLKKPYDPEGEDKKVEELVKIWDDGDFEAFYFSLFWKDPPKVEIPSKYR
jgi:hypothetical protein